MLTPTSHGHLRVLVRHAGKPASSLLSHTPRAVARRSIRRATTGASVSTSSKKRNLEKSSLGFATETSAVLHPTLKTPPLQIESAKGTTVKFSNGVVIEDTTSGAAVACIGYDNERVKNAMIAQIDKFAYSNSMFYGHSIGEELAAELVRGTKGEMSKVYIMCSGK